MSEQPELDIQQILGYFRELVGAQAQEIAVLKATIQAMRNESNGSNE